MKMNMDLENFLTELKVVHINSENTTFGEALIFMMENQVENVSYNVKKKFGIVENSLESLNADGNGNFYLDLDNMNEVDIICDIESNVKTKVSVAGIEMDIENMKIPICCLLYGKISFTFYPDKPMREIYLKFKQFLLSCQTRDKLRRHEVVFKDCVYSYGLIGVRHH